DDMRAGFYRPMYYHTLKAGLDGQGNLVAWKHVIVGQSILTGTAFEPMMVKDGIDGTSVEGAANLPYAIPNLAVELHTPKIAVHESFNTFVAQVVEISQKRIERVVCAVDCGIAVNPNIVAMQMESGIGFGLSAALAGAITLKEGIVEQSNFHDYPVLRMNQMPKIEVHIVPSAEKPSGVGEPATPVIAPALANALASLNGSAVRALPLSAQGLTFACKGPAAVS